MQHKSRFSPIIEEHSSDSNHEISPTVEVKKPDPTNSDELLKNKDICKDKVNKVSIDMHKQIGNQTEGRDVINRKNSKIQTLWKFVMPSQILIVVLIGVTFCLQLYIFHRAIRVVTGIESEIARWQRLRPEEKNILDGEKLIHRGKPSLRL